MAASTLSTSAVVQLVDVQPLPEHAVVGQVLADPAVELGGEEAGDAAHPGVRRLGHDEVEPTVCRGEVRLGVVDHDLGARVVERPAVGRQEDARALDHLGLDLDRHQALAASGCRAAGGTTFPTPGR